MPDIATRFWSKVRKTESCWLWTASTMSFGYGQLAIGWNPCRIQGAHRVSWRLHFGEIPFGMCVLHRCDNPACVRPDHLWLGTKRDNALDAIAKGRSPALRQRTHCPHGHAFVPANTFIRTHRDGRTQQCCRACMRLATNTYKARLRRQHTSVAPKRRK